MWYIVAAWLACSLVNWGLFFPYLYVNEYKRCKVSKYSYERPTELKKIYVRCLFEVVLASFFLGFIGLVATLMVRQRDSDMGLGMGMRWF